MRRIRFAALLLSAAAWIPAQTRDIGKPPTVQNHSLPDASSASREDAMAPAAPSSAWIDTSSRSVVQASYLGTFVPTRSVPMGWAGDLTIGNAGATSQAYRDAVTARINWIRSLAGVPSTVGLSSTYNQGDQQAAMMMSVNGQLNHDPPNTWTFWSQAGATAAGNSNLCLGFSLNDPGCIELYMQDFGANNGEVGHRRWIAYPQTLNMGTGDVPFTGSYLSANALWVIDSATYGGPRPATRDGFVAWPPKGYVPYEFVYPRWSFSYPGADFTKVTASMQRNGNAVVLRQETVANSYGENTLVWVPDNLDANSFYVPTALAADTPVIVTINNALINGTPQSFTYQVIIFDPNTYPPGTTFTLSPMTANFTSMGGLGSVGVTVSPAGTTWAAFSSANWLTLTSGVSNTGNNPIGYSVGANPSSMGRSATITVGNASSTVTQDGAPCSCTLSSSFADLGSAGGSSSVAVTPNPADCSITASWDSWISAHFSGTSLNFSVGRNPGSSKRLGTINISGQVFTITQAGLVPTKIGVFLNGMWVLDSNNNGVFDGSATDAVIGFGGVGSIPVTGDWNGDGRTKVGIFQNGYWYLDYNGDGVFEPGIDKVYYFGNASVTPVVGDWNGDGKTKIGIYSAGKFILDMNGDGIYEAGVDWYFGWGPASGAQPVLGDWNGSGTTKVGVFQQGFWALDYNGDGIYEPGTDKFLQWGQANGIPIVGDWNGSGTTKIGSWSVGAYGLNVGQFVLDYNGNYQFDPGVDPVVPWGSNNSTPVVGDWNGSGTTKIGIYENGFWVLDRNGDFMWNPMTEPPVQFGGGPTPMTPVPNRWP